MDVFFRQRSRSTENACSICLEELKNPRSLPCRHSFCFGCLERHCKDKLPGDDARCPLCRTTFQIPQEGLRGLKHSTDVKKTCEVCSTAEDIKPATVYCVDCSQLLCERCSLPHKKMRGGPHSIRQLVEPNIVHQSDKHAEEVAESYEVVEYRKAMRHVESESRKFLDAVRTVKQQVKERGEAVKRVVDGDTKALLDQLDEMESDTMKGANVIIETLMVALSATVDTGASAQTFISRDLTTSAEDRIITSIIASCYRAPDVAFIPTDIDELKDNKNTIGSVMKSTDHGKCL